MGKLLRTTCLTVCALMFAPYAGATEFQFTYDSAMGVLSGELTGTLQSDGDTIDVTSIMDFANFNGTAFKSLTQVESIEQSNGSSSPPATVTLDGSVLDIVASSSDFNDQFIFDSKGLNPHGFGEFFDVNQGGNSNILAFEQIDPSKWSVQAVAVPEPATLSLFGLGLAGIGFSRLRRKS